MEYVDGITIQQLIAEFGPLPPQRVIHLLLQICGSLSEAHEMGLVHRDIKPANVLVTAHAGLYDMVKVLDFGLVKQIERETMELTQSDGITGTPMYMSPESVRDASTVDERSDLYSIGAVGYMMLTGLPPFDGDATVDICLKQLNEDPIRPSERISCPLPDDLQNILMNSLRKDPDQRPRTVRDFAESLSQCRDAHGWSASDACRWWAEAFAIEVDSSFADPDDDDAAPAPSPGHPRAEASRMRDQDTARQ
jgi:serine/threonine-protein kinase